MPVMVMSTPTSIVGLTHVAGSPEHRCVPTTGRSLFHRPVRPAAGPSLRTDMMSSFALGQMQVRRSGYGAMQLAGPYAFGAPPDRTAAIGVLQAAVAAGVDHIDAAQYYGPGIVNDLIREALYPYPDGLAIVSKVAVRRDDSGAVPSSRSTIRTSCGTGSKRTAAVVATNLVSRGSPAPVVASPRGTTPGRAPTRDFWSRSSSPQERRDDRRLRQLRGSVR
jgi:hypothetical protein